MTPPTRSSASTPNPVLPGSAAPDCQTPAMADRVVRWLPWALVAGAIVWMVQIAAQPIRDPDSWWNLRLGNDLIGQHSLSAPQHWSSFATVSWVPTEPLPDIGAAYVERWLGLPGLAVLFGTTLVAMVVVVQVTNRREAALLPATIATVLAVPAAVPTLTARPQIVSFVLLPVVLAVWLQTERDLKPRWWLVPLVWFWSLCHGFWVIGVLVGFVFVVGIGLSRRADLRAWTRLALLAVACLGVVALNPVGLGVLEGPFAVHQTTRFISEWQRTQLLTAAPLAAALMIAVTAVIWGLTRQRVTWSRALLLVVAAVLLWYAQRLVAVAALSVAPLLAHALDGVVARSGGTTEPSGGAVRRVERRVLAGLALVAVAVLAVLAPHTSQRPGHVPLALDPALDRLPAGTPVFNSYVLGGWLTWRHPDLDQYIDGLTTAYSAPHVLDYLRADGTRPGWYAVVRDSHAPVALVDAQGPLAKGLQQKGWTVVGTDAGYVLLHEPG
jgi:hypothetical protein